MRVKMTFALLAIAALALAVPASSSANRTIHVEEGESIQAAIDRAQPWTTIKIHEGTYSESLLIEKDGIELVGEGRKKTKIVEPGNPTPGQGCVVPPGPDNPEQTVDGICVFPPEDSPEGTTVEDVEIRHLAVEGFDNSIFIHGGEDVEVFRTILSDYGEYGVFALASTGTRIARNVTYNSVAGVNPEAGIYVGSSPDADVTVWKNVSWGNLFGIFLRDASNGKVLDNKSFANCVGILFLATDPATKPAHWLAKDNHVVANNRRCAPGEEAPPLSGAGIAVLGGEDIDLIDNGVFGNQSAEGFESAFVGGIIVTASPFAEAGPVLSTDIKVAFNTAFGNETDLVVDAGNQARLVANDCLTSRPDGLCVDDEQHGGDRDGHGDRHDRKAGKHKKGKKQGGKHRKHRSTDRR